MNVFYVDLSFLPSGVCSPVVRQVNPFLAAGQWRAFGVALRGAWAGFSDKAKGWM